MKDKRIEIRIDNKDNILLKDKANKAGKTVSRYIRDKVFEENKVSDSPKKRCEVAELLKKAENNMQCEEDKHVIRRVGESLWKR